MLRQFAILLRIALVIALAYLFYVFLTRHSATKRAALPHPEAAGNSIEAFDSAYGGSDLKIVQFYAREGVLVEGESTVLCYGVVNATSLTITPPTPGIGPSLNRCVEVAPRHDTTYTLSARDANGEQVTQSLTIRTQADAATLPRITSFGIARHLVEKGRHIFTLSFTFQNGRSVSIDPPVFSPLEDSAPFGQFYVEPEKTTTYMLTVTGADGHKAQKQLTVEVPDK